MKKDNKRMGGWTKKVIFDPALWITLLVSLAIALLGNEGVLRSASTEVGLAQVQIGTALLGIVIAGLAILVIFLDERYIALLEKVSPGFEADLWPFKYTALIAIICAAFGMLLIFVGSPPPIIFRIIFWLSLWSFSYLLWILFDLVKFIAEHAKARIKQIQKNRKD